MEKYKIDLFEKETGNLFPPILKLNKTDCNICYHHFQEMIHVYNSNVSVFENFQSNALFIEKYNALDENFNILDVFTELKLSSNVIYVDWDEFQTIDKFQTLDFSNYFSDIWFPSSDNIIIFPEDMTILIMIRHDGAIYGIKRTGFDSPPQ